MTESWLYANPPQTDDGKSCSHNWVYYYKSRPSGSTTTRNLRKICGRCGLRMSRTADPDSQWEARGYAGYAPCEREHVHPTHITAAPQPAKTHIVLTPTQASQLITDYDEDHKHYPKVKQVHEANYLGVAVPTEWIVVDALDDAYHVKYEANSFGRLVRHMRRMPPVQILREVPLIF